MKFLDYLLRLFKVKPSRITRLYCDGEQSGIIVNKTGDYLVEIPNGEKVLAYLIKDISYSMKVGKVTPGEDVNTTFNLFDQEGACYVDHK